LPNGEVLVAGGYDSNTLASAERYSPGTQSWAAINPMNYPRYAHTATLLPNGKVLVAGDANGTVTMELYDPALGMWRPSAALTTTRGYHTATLLPNQTVLVAGGYNPTLHSLTNSELYDVGLGFRAAWQPQIVSATTPLNLGSALVLSGSQFRGVSEASGGNSLQDSPGDCPVVQLRALESGQTLFLSSTNWSTNSYISMPVIGFPPGWTLATVFVNGIPSASSIILVTATPIAIFLLDPKKLAGGAFQFSFTNTPGAVFTAVATTNPSLPRSNWTAIGSPTEVAPGQFQFVDLQATNHPHGVYRVRWP
jgi:hypothetical protein